ncbi:hypothetical protein ILUMI_12330 [Ignelater luminosus]|uniref:Uncharacterized protein n=1 Tax=Ignelater luminosus TaxID=2038154 RepID=A0A8K0D334_IGNLU|nr:hypothetical protein ILUMI_12330 [Ignelater luminosus]
MINYYRTRYKDSILENFEFKLTNSDIMKIIDWINSNDAGVDKISLAMLKLCSPFVILVIVHIINFAIENLLFPDSWKISRVQFLRNLMPKVFEKVCILKQKSTTGITFWF